MRPIIISRQQTATVNVIRKCYCGVKLTTLTEMTDTLTYDTTPWYRQLHNTCRSTTVTKHTQNITSLTAVY